MRLFPLLLPVIQCLPRSVKHNVIKSRVPIRLQPDDMRFSLGGPVLGLVERCVDALAIISDGKAVQIALQGKLVKALGAAETAIRMAGTNEVVCVFLVEGRSL